MTAEEITKLIDEKISKAAENRRRIGWCEEKVMAYYYGMAIGMVNAFVAAGAMTEEDADDYMSAF